MRGGIIPRHAVPFEYWPEVQVGALEPDSHEGGRGRRTSEPNPGDKLLDQCTS